MLTDGEVSCSLQGLDKAKQTNPCHTATGIQTLGQTASRREAAAARPTGEDSELQPTSIRAIVAAKCMRVDSAALLHHSYGSWLSCSTQGWDRKLDGSVGDASGVPQDLCKQNAPTVQELR